MRSKNWFVALACALWMLLPVVRAQDADWSALGTGTRDLLAPWQDAWKTLDAGSRARLLANANRWQKMGASARDAFQRRSTDWQALPPAERARRRSRYVAWVVLAPAEQARVRAAALQFSALPIAQQTAVRVRFAAQDADQQRAWLLGPGDGGWIGQARTLFAYVPDRERNATLRMLEALSTDARVQLFALARRLPDEQREQLRRQLLIAEPAQREALLRQRMAQ